MLYSPFSAALEKTRLMVQKRFKDGQLAYLGDSVGAGARVEIPDLRGYVYARFPGVPDVNGNATFSAPFPVRAGNAAYPNYPGASVYVAVGYNGELEIVSANYQELDQTGIDTRVLNPLAQQSKWVYLWQLTIGLCSAVANSVSDSFLVTVKKFRYYVGSRFQTFETGVQADKIDLEPYMPGVDEHRYAAVWLDTYTNTASVTTSTTQSLFTPLDATDITELVTHRPPDAVPLKAFYLANNAGTVTQDASSDVDLRQFMNMPQLHGFNNPVAYRERIQPDKQQLYAGTLVVTGMLEVLGSLIGIDTVDDTGGSSGGSGMTSFTAAGDTGTPQTIGNGDTLSILGGTGLSSVASATDTVTVNLDNTAVTPGSYTYMSGTVDAQGRLTAAANGTTPVTSVGLSMPTEFSVSGSPVTTTGTLAVTKATQVANTVYAGPVSGSDDVPTFRALEVDDVPPTGNALLTIWHMFDFARAGANIVITNTASQAFNHYAAQASPTINDEFEQVIYLDAGAYSTRMLYAKSTNGGQLRVRVRPSGGGTALLDTTVDFYANPGTFNQIYTFSTFTVTDPGDYKISGLVNGKNASSSGYTIALTCFYISRN